MSKKPKPAKSRGRPSKYKPEYCAQIVAAAKANQTLEMFACEIGVHIDTLYEWAKEHDDFSEAKKLARQHHLVNMQKLGMAGIAGKLKGFSSAAWIFWMKAQHSWNEGGNDADQDNDLEFV